MALLYLNAGERFYGQEPVAIYPRRWWAFQFILDGAAAMALRDRDGSNRQLRMEGDWLTVAGPELPHGWTGHAQERCEVLVFHFDEVPTALARLVGPQGLLRFRIGRAARELGAKLYQRCQPGQREAEREVQSQVAAAELSLLVLQHQPELPSPPDMARLKVERALAWYSAHLPEAPTVEAMATAVHLSPAHLRRLFHQVRGKSPHQALEQLRFERAIDLMRDPALTLERIAESAGFGSASAFSRAFRGLYKTTPGQYRTTFLG